MATRGVSVVEDERASSDDLGGVSTHRRRGRRKELPTAGCSDGGCGS